MHPGLVVGASFYAAVGAFALVRPASVPALFGGTAPTASSRTEVRAVYGGLPLAMAVVVLAEAARPSAARSGTRTVAALSAAMAVGRTTGAALEGGADATTRLFIALEAATAVALAAGARAR